MNYYLAIDQGTHASRAVLYNEAGELIASHVEPVSLFYREKSHIEQNPAEIVSSIVKAVDTLLEKLDATIRQRITACGIACQRSTVVICNHQAEPLSPAISWQDTRGTSYLNTLPLSAKQVQTLSGLPLSPHYAASKFRWLLEHHPPLQPISTDELYLAPLVSFLLLQLTQSSSFVVDHSHAQRMQLMDIQHLDWSEELTSAFHIPQDCLPHCKPMCDDYGLLSHTSIPVTAVCGDQNAALLGSGELNQETALINLGSGAFVLRKLPTFKVSKRLLTGIAYSSSTQENVDYLREGTINGAGNAVSWFHHGWSSQDIEQWWQQLPTWLDDVDNPPLFINTVGGLGSPWWCSAVDTKEPYFDDSDEGHYPDLKQERCTNMDTGLRRYDGISLTSDDISLTNDKTALISIEAKSVAIIESIVFLIEDNLRIMAEEYPLKLLKLSGGLSQLDGLCQKIANLSGLPVQRLIDKETTARGVAWLCSGKSTAWPTSSDTCFEPAKDEALHERYLRFHHLIKGLCHE